MSLIISFPVVILLMVLQTTFARQLTLLNGSADLLLIWMAAWSLQSRDNSAWLWAFLAGALFSYVSAVPWYVSITAYIAIVVMARFITRKLWQSPLMSMFILTLIGSLFLYFLTFIGLRVEGVDYPFRETLVRIIIPSVFLNLLLAIPIYGIVKDTTRWVFKEEVDS